MNKALAILRALGATGIALTCCMGSAPLHADVACSFTSQALRFPNYNAFENTPTDGNGTVIVRCTNLSNSAISNSAVALGIGTSSHGTASDRKMVALSGNADLLRYGIYRDAARSLNWDQGNSAVVQRTGSMQANETKTLNFILFGRIAPQQNVHAGNYSDVVTLFITP